MDRVLSGYLAGLAVGVNCLGLCLPIFLPLLLSQKQTAKSAGRLIIEFSLGRLAGYLFFGLIFGWFGVLIKIAWVHQLAAAVNIWIGVLLILYSLGSLDQKFCAFLPFAKIKWPFWLGFLTGVNICPPFLASLTYVFNLKDVLASLFFFLMFFLGTSTYIVPAALLGVFTQIPWFPLLAKISGAVVGVYFIWQSLARFW